MQDSIVLRYTINKIKMRRVYSRAQEKVALTRAAVLRKNGVAVEIIDSRERKSYDHTS